MGETKQTLAQASRRVGRLEKRLDALEAEVVDAREREAALAEALEKARRDYAEGGADLAAVKSAERDVREHKRGIEEQTSALAMVQRELGEVQARVRAAAAEAERRRQETASEPLRKRAAELEETFVSNVADLLKPLRERQEIREKIAREYPLASLPAPLSFDVLTTALRERWQASGRPGGGVGLGANVQFGFRQYLRVLMVGPCGAGAEGERVVRQLGIAER